MGATGLILLANEKVKATNLSELLTEIKNSKQGYSYGSHGKGSTVHFAAEMLWSAANVNVTHIPYKGGAPALIDLAGGQIPIGFDAIPAGLNAVKNGRVKPIAVTTSTRSPMFPNVPTIAESGFPGFKMESWFAIVGPAGIPSEVQSKIEKALKDTVENSDIFKKLAQAGYRARFSTRQPVCVNCSRGYCQAKTDRRERQYDARLISFDFLVSIVLSFRLKFLHSSLKWDSDFRDRFFYGNNFENGLRQRFTG